MAVSRSRTAPSSLRYLLALLLIGISASVVCGLIIGVSRGAASQATARDPHGKIVDLESREGSVTFRPGGQLVVSLPRGMREVDLGNPELLTIRGSLIKRNGDTPFFQQSPERISGGTQWPSTSFIVKQKIHTASGAQAYLLYSTIMGRLRSLWMGDRTSTWSGAVLIIDNATSSDYEFWIGSYPRAKLPARTNVSVRFLDRGVEGRHELNIVRMGTRDAQRLRIDVQKYFTSRIEEGIEYHTSVTSILNVERGNTYSVEEALYRR